MSRIAWPGEQRERLGLDLQEPPAAGVERRHAVGGEQPVRRVVGAERQQLLVLEVDSRPRPYRSDAVPSASTDAP